MADEPKRLGVAVVGAGYWGPNLVRNFMGHDHVELQWVCDLDLERAAAVAGRRTGVKATAELSEVLDDPSVEAIAIATPPASHHRLALAAIRAGRHVIVEKPLGISAGEADALVSAADAEGVVLMCDHVYCYTEPVKLMRELIGSGDLGTIQFIDSVRINLGLVQRDTDVLWDLAPHDISILDFILPATLRLESVSAAASDPIGAGRPCVGYLTVRLTGGALAHVHVNWLSPVKIRTMIIGGSNRNLVWDDLNPSQPVSLYNRGVQIAPDDLDTARRIRISYRTGEMVAPALPQVEALKNMVDEFTAAIHERREPLTGGRSGARVLRVLEAARCSLAANGAFVDIEPES